MAPVEAAPWLSARDCSGPLLMQASDTAGGERRSSHLKVTVPSSRSRGRGPSSVSHSSWAGARRARGRRVGRVEPPLCVSQFLESGDSMCEPCSLTSAFINSKSLAVVSQLRMVICL